MATPALNAQIRREQTMRRKEEMALSRQKYTASWDYSGGGLGYGYGYGLRMPKRTGGDDKTKNDKKAVADGTPINGAHMQRVRINSQAILGHLTSLLGETERRSTPRTFMRPFKPLVYFQPKMKEILASLEEKWADKEAFEDVESDLSVGTPEEDDLVEAEPESTAKASASSSSGDDNTADDDSNQEDEKESLQSVDSNAEDIEFLMDGVDALRDMRCYVDFVENEVVPLYNQFNDPSVTRVRFDDLWALFRVGDLIHMPPSNESTERYHELWRVYRVKSPLPNSKYSGDRCRASPGY